MSDRANRDGYRLQTLLANLLEQNPSLLLALAPYADVLEYNDIATAITYIIGHQNTCHVSIDNPLFIRAKELVKSKYISTTIQLFESLLAMQPCDPEVQEAAFEKAIDALDSRYSKDDGSRLIKALFASSTSDQSFFDRAFTKLKTNIYGYRPNRYDEGEQIIKKFYHKH
jgi:hypothetical protein